MSTFTVTVPDDLARDLKDAGLLSPDATETMATLLRDSPRRYMVGDLIRTVDRLLVPKGPTPRLEEIQQEVKVVRMEMRQRAALS